MAMLFSMSGDARAVLLGSPVMVELQTVYQERPADRPQRSAADLGCAQLMLQKLWRREDILDQASPHDAEQVLDVVVERISQILSAGEAGIEGSG